MNTTAYLHYIQDLLAPFAVTALRPMFGGHGVYVHGVMMALIANDQIYFKANNEQDRQFMAAGSVPFTYLRGDQVMALSYWQVPSSIQDDREQLEAWFRAALKTALSAPKRLKKPTTAGKKAVVKR